MMRILMISFALSTTPNLFAAEFTSISLQGRLSSTDTISNVSVFLDGTNLGAILSLVPDAKGVFSTKFSVSPPDVLAQCSACVISLKKSDGTVISTSPLRSVPFALTVRGDAPDANILRASGNIGIGTTNPNPAYKLDVAGDGRFSIVTANGFYGSGTGLTDITASSIAINGVYTNAIRDSAVTDAKIAAGLSASKLVGALPAINGASLTNLTKTQVGLSNVDNTADMAKPVSTAQRAELDLKAPLASPTFTGTVGGISAFMVGLGNVDNTSDADKPVSMAQLAALNAKANDDATVHLIGAEIISGAKTFSNDVNFPGSGIWQVTGNVGIGTTVPESALTVVGDVNISGAYKVNGVPIGGSGIAVLSGTQTFTGLNTFNAITASSLNIPSIAGDSGAYGLTVSSNISLAHVLYTANDMVGIGKATPEYKLDVAGDGYFTSSVTAGEFHGDGSKLTGLTASQISGMTGDNLGNHKATTSLDMNSQSINNVAFLTINPWRIFSGSNQTLSFERSNQEGEVAIPSKLTLMGNLAHYPTPTRSPELKWSYERAENFLKWRLQPTLQHRGGMPGYYVVTDLRLDLDSSFYNPDTGAITTKSSVVTMTKDGAFATAGPKSFVQQHPTDSNKEIYYFALEGPEAGTYVRGNAQLSNGTAVVSLPDNFAMVTSELMELSVQVTPLDDCNGLYVMQKSTSQILVKELKNGNSDAKFSYLVQGIRKSYENIQVIREKPKTTEDLLPL